MKIGILTFHYGSNYGGVLQCYALQEILLKLGYDVQIINYVPNNIKHLLTILHTNIKKNGIKGLSSFFLYLKYSKKCREVFCDFTNKYLNLTGRISKYKDLKYSNFDAIIVGSDQVWNSSQHKSPIYFLNWVDKTKCKKISYAACCGLNIVDDCNKEILKKELNDFNLISVRSNETVFFVKNLINVTPTIVCDPTMLYDFDEFKTHINEKYILAYILGNDIKGGNHYVIENIRNKYPNHKVIALIIGNRYINPCKWADILLYNVSPTKWVSLVYNSSFVFTDSYHGSVFSMKYNKPFIAYYTSPVSGKRFEDLEKSYEMKNIITSAYEVKKVLDNNNEINYNYSSKIKSDINISMEFLRSISVL